MALTEKTREEALGGAVYWLTEGVVELDTFLDDYIKIFAICEKYGGSNLVADEAGARFIRAMDAAKAALRDYRKLRCEG